MSKPKFAITLLVFIITSLYFYHTHPFSEQALGESSSAGSYFTMADTTILSNLVISIRQTASEPITLAVTVKNNNPTPITFLSWDSPLDPLALQLGILAITPVGSSEPLDIPTIKVSRKLPPAEDALVELGAGQTSQENVVVLKEMLVGKPLRELQADRVSVKFKGEWRALWNASRSGLDADSIEKMGADERAVSGEFESEAFDVMIK